MYAISHHAVPWYCDTVCRTDTCIYDFKPTVHLSVSVLTGVTKNNREGRVDINGSPGVYFTEIITSFGSCWGEKGRLFGYILYVLTKLDDIGAFFFSLSLSLSLYIYIYIYIYISARFQPMKEDVMNVTYRKQSDLGVRKHIQPSQLNVTQLSGSIIYSANTVSNMWTWSLPW